MQHLERSELVFAEFVGPSKVVNFVGNGLPDRAASLLLRLLLTKPAVPLLSLGLRGSARSGGRRRSIAVATQRIQQGFNFRLA